MQISIGMPVYNGGEYLHFAIESLLQQDHEAFELILSDNASSDNTPEICQKFASQDRRIRYYRQAENIGALGNFNFVFQKASSEYFMWAACDDIWEPQFISSLVEALDRNAALSLAFCHHDRINEQNKSFLDIPHVADLQGTSQLDELRRYLLQPERYGKATLIYGLMRRQHLAELNGFRLHTANGWGADMHMVFRLLTFGRLYIHPRTLYHKRLIPELISPSPTASRSALRKALSKLKRGAQAWQQFNAYLSGYRRIILQAPLSLRQKTVLLGLCEKRLWKEQRLR